MAKRESRITADTDAAGTASKAAKKRADAAFKKTQKAGAAEVQAKEAGETLKATIMSMSLPELRDVDHHMRSIAGWKSKLDEINGHLRKAWKSAEAAGIDTAALKLTFKWSKRDPVEIVRMLLSFNQQMKLLNSTVQLQIIDESSLNLTEKALADGQRAGLAGKHENPHDMGTPSFEKWEDGYIRGQTELAGRFKAPEDGEPEWPDDPEPEAADADAEPAYEAA